MDEGPFDLDSRPISVKTPDVHTNVNIDQNATFYTAGRDIHQTTNHIHNHFYAAQDVPPAPLLPPLLPLLTPSHPRSPPPAYHDVEELEQDRGREQDKKGNAELRSSPRRPRSSRRSRDQKASRGTGRADSEDPSTTRAPRKTAEKEPLQPPPPRSTSPHNTPSSSPPLTPLDVGNHPLGLHHMASLGFMFGLKAHCLFSSIFPCCINCNAMDQVGRTPIMWACEAGNLEAVARLLEEGDVRVDVVDRFGDTALVLAVKGGWTAIVKALVRRRRDGVGINKKDERGKSALLHAVVKGKVEIVNALLSASGIDVNQKDDEGKTALIHAALKGYEEIVKALLGISGIDLNAKDKEGKSAIVYANENENRNVVELLLDAGAVIPHSLRGVLSRELGSPPGFLGRFMSLFTHSN